MKKLVSVVLSLEISFFLFGFGAAAFAQHKNWDGNYDATVQGSCDPWVFMDSWTVANNNIVTPYGEFPIDEWGGARVEVASGGRLIEIVNFVFEEDQGVKTFRADWRANERSDGTGRECRGNLRGRCVSGCDTFNLGGLFAPGGPGLFIVFVIIIVIIVLIVRAGQRRRLQPIGLPPAEPPIKGQLGGAPPPAPPGPPPAEPPAPEEGEPAEPEEGERKFRPEYGKKIAKKPPTPGNRRLQR